MTPRHSLVPGTARAADALSHLAELLRNGAEWERILDGYIETRSELAKAFRRIVEANLIVTGALEAARVAVESQLRFLFGATLPGELLSVRRYSPTHSLLLEYLLLRVGTAVPAVRLRLVTGDQVHTERRVRELRTLGFEVQSFHSAGKQQYSLLDKNPDVLAGAMNQAKANIRGSKRLGREAKASLLALVEHGQPAGN